MNLRTCLALASFATAFFYTFQGLALDRPAPEAPWEPVGNSEGVSVFRRLVPGSPVMAFKGNGTVEAPIWKIISIFLDNASSSQWMENVAEARVVRLIGPLEYITYSHARTPFILKDRDFVNHVQIESDPKAKSLVIRFHSTEDPQVPKTSYVRGNVISSTVWVKGINNNQSTEISAEVHVDPNGSIPKWIVNMVQKEWAWKTFRALRARAAKTDLRAPPHFEALAQQYR